MTVEDQYASDVDVILSHKHDNGADLWTTPDKRLIKGAPFSTLESVTYLLELGMGPTESLLQGAAALIFSTCRRTDISSCIHKALFTHAKQSMQPMYFATWGTFLMSDCKKHCSTFWISNISLVAGDAINSVLAGVQKQSIQIPSQRLMP